MKVDVEDYKLEILIGTLCFLKTGNMHSIDMECPPGGWKGTKSEGGLREELYSNGYSRFHLQRFGICHDDRVHLPSVKCNFPFSTYIMSRAPTFKQYVQVFELINKTAKQK